MSYMRSREIFTTRFLSDRVPVQSKNINFTSRRTGSETDTNHTAVHAAVAAAIIAAIIAAVL